MNYDKSEKNSRKLTKILQYNCKIKLNGIQQ